ncbi:hypothetical protein PMN51_19085, partial [Blautia wexlerae]|nr:hypothetical protein [Blautia wexlerae]
MTYEEIQKIKHLREVTSVMVEESSNGIECTKNRFGNRTMDGCKNDENTPTEAKYQGRLDYAIASPSFAR